MPKKIYQKTDDPDIFEEVRKVKKDISLGGLEAKSLRMEDAIKNLPEPKTTPDTEAMKFWNEMNVEQIDRKELIQDKKDLDALIVLLKKL